MGVRGKNVVRRSGGGVTRATRPGPWLVEDLSRDAHPGQHAAREVCKDLTLTLQDRAVLGKRPENQLRAYRCLRDAHCTFDCVRTCRQHSLAAATPVSRFFPGSTLSLEVPCQLGPPSTGSLPWDS